MTKKIAVVKPQPKSTVKPKPVTKIDCGRVERKSVTPSKGPSGSPKK